MSRYISRALAVAIATVLFAPPGFASARKAQIKAAKKAAAADYMRRYRRVIRFNIRAQHARGDTYYTTDAIEAALAPGAFEWFAGTLRRFERDWMARNGADYISKLARIEAQLEAVMSYFKDARRHAPAALREKVGVYESPAMSSYLASMQGLVDFADRLEMPGDSAAETHDGGAALRGGPAPGAGAE